MATIATTQISNGQSGDATVVDQNFDTIVNAINGNLDTTNLSPTAGMVPTQLSNRYRARAYRSTSQSISTGAITKVQFDTETYDGGSNWDNATNYRFVASVAGYYQVNVCVTIASTAAASRVISYIYKNGTAYASNPTSAAVATSNSSMVSDVVQLAVSDYVEGFVFQDSGTSKNVSGSSSESYISVHLLSAA